MSLDTSSTPISNPHSSSNMASYHVARKLCRAHCPPCHRHACAPLVSCVGWHPVTCPSQCLAGPRRRGGTLTAAPTSPSCTPGRGVIANKHPSDVESPPPPPPLRVRMSIQPEVTNVSCSVNGSSAVSQRPWRAAGGRVHAPAAEVGGRGLHSSTSQLNLSGF
jgi:hypothetical protein